MSTQGVPLSRFSRAELHRLVSERGFTAASAVTIARWLAEDSLKPWQRRSWIFPTDPEEPDPGPPPTHASWLDQVEIYFSILQRKVLTPNDFDDLALLARTLNEFERHWSEVAEPFEWNFTRDKLAELMERLSALSRSCLAA
jgi:hypothetical protein